MHSSLATQDPRLFEDITIDVDGIEITCLAVSRNGQIAAGTSTGHLGVWDSQSGAIIHWRSTTAAIIEYSEQLSNPLFAGSSNSTIDVVPQRIHNAMTAIAIDSAAEVVTSVIEGSLVCLWDLDGDPVRLQKYRPLYGRIMLSSTGYFMAYILDEQRLRICRTGKGLQKEPSLIVDGVFTSESVFCFSLQGDTIAVQTEAHRVGSGCYDIRIHFNV